MKSLVIYYSLTENTKFIAETVAREIGADVLVLRTVDKKIQPKGFMKYIWGGRQVFMKEAPELEPLEKDPADYELLIIGTPVWAWNFTPPLKSFFAAHKLSGKKIAIFCTHGGGPGKTLDNMAAELAGNEIVGRIDFKEPLRYGKDEAAVKAKEWVRGFNPPLRRTADL